MTITVRCQQCGQGFRLQQSMTGRVVPCRECGAKLIVPDRPSNRSGAKPRPRQPVYPDGRSNDSKIPAGVWIGGGIGLLILLVALGIFLWSRNSSTAVGESADGGSGSGPTSDNMWSAPPEGVASLGEEIAFGRYSLRMPIGWMPSKSSFGDGHASIEWKWPDASIDAKLMFEVKLNSKYRKGDAPYIITEPGQYPHIQGKDLYIYTGADQPERGRIDGVEFYRVNSPEFSGGRPQTRSDFIAILDGASVHISIDIKLPEHSKLCQQAKAAALSFKKNATNTPVLTFDEMQSSERQSGEGFPKPRVISGNLAEWGLKPKQPFLGVPEYAILLSDEDAESAVLSTPQPNYIAIQGVVYSLLEKGKEVGRFEIPAELQELEYKALRDDGKMMAFADDLFSRQNGRIHLLSDGGKVWNYLEENQTKSSRPVRLEFIHFLPGHRLAAGWRLSDEEVNIYNLETGEQKRFPVDSVESSHVGFSRDGRFLVGIDKNHSKPVLFSIENPGRRLMFPTPADVRSLSFTWTKGWQFSPDGTEVAGIVDNRLLRWSTEGQLLMDAKLPSDWTTKFDDDGPALQWTADGSGWLIWGRQLVDRNNTEIRWSLPPPQTWDHLHRFNRILEDGRLLIGQTGDEETPFSLLIYPKLSP